VDCNSIFEEIIKVFVLVCSRYFHRRYCCHFLTSYKDKTELDYKPESHIEMEEDVMNGTDSRRSRDNNQ
jgi:hypothetical protein